MQKHLVHLVLLENQHQLVLGMVETSQVLQQVQATSLLMVLHQLPLPELVQLQLQVEQIELSQKHYLKQVLKNVMNLVEIQTLY
jgi:hypothetical protein